eukprot:3550381-Pleurochrysis_carterae.AAC.1
MGATCASMCTAHMWQRRKAKRCAMLEAPKRPKPRTASEMAMRRASADSRRWSSSVSRPVFHWSANAVFSWLKKSLTSVAMRCTLRPRMSAKCRKMTVSRMISGTVGLASLGKGAAASLLRICSRSLATKGAWH